MEREIQYRRLNDLIIVVDALKVMQCRLADQVVFLVSLHSVKVRNSKTESIERCRPKQKGILLPYPCFCCVEECDERASGCLIWSKI